MRRCGPTLCLVLTVGWLPVRLTAEAAFYQAELIFPLEEWHNHASSLVELPNGDIFAVWYHGSGERTADDVEIQAALLRRGARSWTSRYTIADVKGFPDCNPALFLDREQRLWLLWPTILDNRWESALLNLRITRQLERLDRPPRWEIAGNLLLRPRNFEERVRAVVEPWLARASPGSVEERYLRQILERAGDKLSRRLGWMPRAHPVQLPSGRILVPLYSDGFSFSLVAITDDGGENWTTSEPIIGWGAIQPSIVQKRDGTLVAYMRDNGPPPKRLQVATSADQGLTWSLARDTEIPNPGSAAEVIRLRDGSWALVYNDTEKGRYSLAISISDDEGKTWRWKRHLEYDPRQRNAYHYPSIIQARDGSLHVTYSYFVTDESGRTRKAVKHARFNVEWVKAGDSSPAN